MPLTIIYLEMTITIASQVVKEMILSVVKQEMIP